MKLTLSQQELEQAVRNYVTGMISLQANTDITIDFKAGRGENGVTAEVDINYLAVTSIPAVAATAGAPLAAVIAAKPEGARTASAVKAAAGEAAALAAASRDTDKPIETRATTGKSLFGDIGKGSVPEVDPAAEPANDSGEAGSEAALTTAATTGGRRTLFSEATAG